MPRSCGEEDEALHYFTDILVIGGGIAGLQAALVAGGAGAKVLLLEQSPRHGGRAVTDGVHLAGRPAAEWVAASGQIDSGGSASSMPPPRSGASAAASASAGSAGSRAGPQ
nr:FAD-dependent oxidoreductase [Mangrovicoccus ximenensis]